MITKVITSLPATRYIRTMITTLDKTEIKEQMLDICIEKQQHLIDDFRNRINDLLENTPEVSPNSEDPLFTLFCNSIDEVDLLNDALIFAHQEMNLLRFLQSASTMVHDRVAIGSVVVTNVHTFFIAAGVEKFQYNGEAAFGLSANSPLFNVMQGRKKGDSFLFNQVLYFIEEVY